MFFLLRMNPLDAVAFIISSFIGYMATYYLPQGPIGIWVAVLLSYHLFLAWLVISAEHETGMSLPVAMTIMTHAACLVIVLSFVYGRSYIPFFGYVRYGITSMAFFERGWLFSGGKKKEVVEVAPSAAVPAPVCTASDYQEWLDYMIQPHRPTRKPGLSVQDEMNQWLTARAKARAIAPPTQSQG
jgi:hypothetical protein